MRLIHQEAHSTLIIKQKQEGASGSTTLPFLDKMLLNIKHLQSRAPCEQFMASQSAVKTIVISVIYYYLDFEQN